MFKSEFQTAAIDAMVETSKRFGSTEGYLLRLRADVERELGQVAIAAEQGTEFAKMFCDARARECYLALNRIDLHLANLGY
ncbi:MAG TPA: hypothetical protein VIT65_10755 [Microlunatus sp.]